MKPRPWIPAVFLAIIAALFLTWSAAHSRLRHGVLYDTTPKAPDDQPVWILNGTLSTMVTIPVDAANLELAVPANSWVVKGQVIGTADCEMSEQISQALFRLEEASAAVADANKEAREIDRELDTVRTDARNTASELIRSETAELETKDWFERSDRLYRQQAASQLDHDAAISARDTAVSDVAAARSRLRATSTRINDLEMRSSAARASLFEAMTRSAAAEAAFQHLKESPERGPVVAPADGLLVASDVLPGTFGIASDPALLCVHTRVRQADIASLRLGQPALITIYGEPSVNHRAKVSAIARNPIDSPDGAAYPVTLSVEDLDGKQFAGASVEIRLQAPPK